MVAFAYTSVSQEAPTTSCESWDGVRVECLFRAGVRKGSRHVKMSHSPALEAYQASGFRGFVGDVGGSVFRVFTSPLEPSAPAGRRYLSEGKSERKKNVLSLCRQRLLVLADNAERLCSEVSLRAQRESSSSAASSMQNQMKGC